MADKKIQLRHHTDNLFPRTKASLIEDDGMITTSGITSEICTLSGAEADIEGTDTVNITSGQDVNISGLTTTIQSDLKLVQPNLKNAAVLGTDSNGIMHALSTGEGISAYNNILHTYMFNKSVEVTFTLGGVAHLDLDLRGKLIKVVIEGYIKSNFITYVEQNDYYTAPIFVGQPDHVELYTFSINWEGPWQHITHDHTYIYSHKIISNEIVAAAPCQKIIIYYTE